MDVNKRVHTFKDDALGDLDAIGIAEKIRNKEISVSEITQASIDRARFANPQLNAIVLEQFETALNAQNFVPNRPFSGVPFFFKDNVDIAGLPSQQGSRAFKAQPAKKTWDLCQQFLDQGFNVLGKTALPEFGLNASTEFKDGRHTSNPWHTDYSCGASSGGAAALVASGVVPIAHANDGGGSIRIPAASCGLIGLKPSRGRFIIADSAKTLPIDIISEGVLTRSVRDTAHFYASMEQSYFNNKLSKIGLIEHASQRKLKIGLVEESIQGRIDLETKQTLIDTAQLLEGLGHHVEIYKLPFPDSFVDDFSHYWGSLSFLLCTFGKQLFNSSFNAHEVDHLTRGLSDLYKKNFYKTPLFLYRLKKIKSLYEQMFDDYDIILSPVLAHTTPKLGYLSPQLSFDELFDRLQNYVTFTPIHNIAGAPAISLPMSQTKTDGLPISMHFSAKIGAEKTLIELAYAIEEAKPWRRIQDQ